MDSKATIKISFDIYGEHYEADMHINYWPYERVDPRISDWFNTCYEDAHNKFKHTPLDLHHYKVND